MQKNPYEPTVLRPNNGDPETDTRSLDVERAWITGEKPRPGVSPIGTTMARHIAAVLDKQRFGDKLAGTIVVFRS
jgi:hypothetical protein